LRGAWITLATAACTPWLTAISAVNPTATDTVPPEPECTESPFSAFNEERPAESSAEPCPEDGFYVTVDEAEYAAMKARQAAAEAWADNIEQTFPFRLEKTEGYRAFDRWQQLRAKEKDHVPVIIGTRQDLLTLAEGLVPIDPETDVLDTQTTEDFLTSAAKHTFPTDYEAFLKEEVMSFAAYLKEQEDEGLSFGADFLGPGDPLRKGELQEPPLGRWPRKKPELVTFDFRGLPIITHDLASGEPFEEVFIVMLPTTFAFEAPAWLRYGGWNAYPPADHHVAALRSWDERFGAELMVLSSNFVAARLGRLITTKEEAEQFAKELYLYCPDIIDQGYGDVRSLAHSLINNDLLLCWWD